MRHKDGSCWWLEYNISNLTKVLGVGGFVFNLCDDNNCLRFFADSEYST